MPSAARCRETPFSRLSFSALGEEFHFRSRLSSAKSKEQTLRCSPKPPHELTRTYRLANMVGGQYNAERGISMNRGTRAGITFGVVILLFSIFSQTAYASIEAGTLVQATRSYYLGVGTIRMLVQVLAGVGIGMLAIVFSVYRLRVRVFFANLFSGRRHANESEESEEGEESEESA